MLLDIPFPNNFEGPVPHWAFFFCAALLLVMAALFLFKR
jgi:hypothetical protein